MAKYQQYAEYKDSGVEWLGEIPKHWGITSLKYEVLINMGQSPNSEDCNVDGNGIPFLQGNAEFGIRSPIEKQYCPIPKKIANAGDLLFSVRAPVGALNLANKNYGIGRGLCSLKSRGTLESAFLWWLLPTYKYQLDAIATGSTFEAVSAEQVGNLSFALPLDNEQIQIANFLDHETAQINSLIEKQQQLIQLLKEKRQAVISHAVTKGLNPNVPMKDSGVEWLGAMPEHWTLSNLKYFASIQGGYAFNSDLFVEEGTQVLRIGNVYQNTLSLDRQPTYISNELVKNFKNFIVSKNDVLMSLTGTLGKRDYGFAIKVKTDENYLLNQRVAKISPNHSKIDTDFMVYVLWSESYLTQLYSLPSGTKQANLSNSDVLGIQIVIPPSLEEQQAIAKYLENKLLKFDDMILKAESAIQLMQERRTALISAAVTGKIDVCNWQNPNKNNEAKREFSA